MNTSHAIVTVGNESRKRTGAQTRQLKEARTLPVSTKFYKRLTDKVKSILKEIHAPQLAEPMIEFIDRYLADRDVAPPSAARPAASQPKPKKQAWRLLPQRKSALT